jgi:hypothetical protein
MDMQDEMDPEHDLWTDIRGRALALPEPLYPTLSKLRKELEKCKRLSVISLFPS